MSSEKSAVNTSFEPVRPEDVNAGMPYTVEPVPVNDPTALNGVRIAMVCADGFEEVEGTYPLNYLTSRGATVDVITPDWIPQVNKNRVMAVQFLKPSLWIPVTKPISQANVSDYGAVFVPGGAWNPIVLRTDAAVLEFLRAASTAGLVLSSICHGPQVLISAGLVSGRKLTGVADIRQDLRNAGATVFDDQASVVDGNLVTSRDPHDLAIFCQTLEMSIKTRRS